MSSVEQETQSVSLDQFSPILNEDIKRNIRLIQHILCIHNNKLTIGAKERVVEKINEIVKQFIIAGPMELFLTENDYRDNSKQQAIKQWENVFKSFLEMVILRIPEFDLSEQKEIGKYDDFERTSTFFIPKSVARYYQAAVFVFQIKLDKLKQANSN